MEILKNFVAFSEYMNFNIRKKACICSAQFWSDTLLQIVGITLVNTKNGTKYKYATAYPHYYLFIESHKGCSKRKGYPKKFAISKNCFWFSNVLLFVKQKKRELPISSHYLRHFFPLFCSRLYWRIVHNWVKFILEEHPTATNIFF